MRSFLGGGFKRSLTTQSRDTFSPRRISTNGGVHKDDVCIVTEWFEVTQVRFGDDKFYSLDLVGSSNFSYPDGSCVVYVLKRTYQYVKGWISNCGDTRFQSGKFTIEDKTIKCGTVIERERTTVKDKEDEGEGVPSGGGPTAPSVKDDSNSPLTVSGTSAGIGQTGGSGGVTVRIFVQTVPGIPNVPIGIDPKEQYADVQIAVDLFTYKLMVAAGYGEEAVGSGGVSRGGTYDRFYVKPDRIDALRLYAQLGNVYYGENKLQEAYGLDTDRYRSERERLERIEYAEQMAERWDPNDPY